MKTCPDLANARYGRRLYIFGAAVSAGVEYRLLGGFYVERKQGRDHLLTDPAGAIAILRNNACTLAGPARDEFDHPDQDVGRTALQALATDAAARYARAFGGQAALARMLRARGVRLDAKTSPILAMAFSARSGE